MKCYKCGKEKDITLFTKINRHKDNKVGLCKQCKYLQDKKYREEHKEHIAKMKKIYWQNDVNGIKKKNRDTIDKKRVGVTAEYLEDKVCEICGITNEECKKKYGCRLSIHHKDNNGRHNINNGKTPVHDNLQVLCNACHCRISNLTERDYSNWDKVLKKDGRQEEKMKEKIIYKNIEELIPYDKNPRINDNAVDKVAESIKQFGFKSPIVLDKNNVIICGHTRLKASQRLGLKEVPCIVADDLTEEQIKAYRLADNKTAEYAEWDFNLLNEELDSIIDIDMSDFGFDLDLDIEEEQEIIEDEVPDVSEEPKAKLGDIYQLGRHFLMCGDSTSEEDVAKLMNGVKADMVFTDPPYGMKKENDGVANDNLNYDDLLEFNKKWIPITFNNLKDNGSWYCWGIDEPLMDIYSNILKPMAKENKITFRNLITWDKGIGKGQLLSELRMYPIADEKCLFVQVGIQCLTLNADQYWEEYEPIRKYLYDERIKCGWDIPTMKTIAGHSDKSRDHWTSKSQWNLPTEDVYMKFQNWAKEHNINAFTKQYEELRAQYEELRAYFDNTHDNMNNVWHFSKTSGEERKSAGGHATPKPIALCTRAIKSSSRENGNVLDVFGGSGSTLIACEQNNRNCYVMELEPKWVDVIIQRWENFTGEKAIKLN